MPNQRKKVPAVCQACGAQFMASFSEQKIGNGKFCSQYCSRSTQARKNAAALKSSMSRKEMARLRRQRTPPEVIAAHRAVTAAVIKGVLVKSPCEVCGSVKKLDAHHDDYSKPLDIRWLCRKHHLMHHRAQPTPT